MESHHKYEFVIKCPTKYYLREISISLLRYFHTPEYAWAYTDSENNTITIEISEYRYSRVCELLVSAEKKKYAKKLFIDMAESDGYVHPKEAAIIERFFK